MSPRVKLANAQQRLDDMLIKMQAAMQHDLALQRERVSSLAAQLNAFNPLNVLARGYAVVRKEPTGEVVRSVAQVKPDEPLMVRVSDGEFKAHAERE